MTKCPVVKVKCVQSGLQNKSNSFYALNIFFGVSVVALLAVVIMFTSDVFSELTVKVSASLNVDDQEIKHQTSEVNAEELNREWRQK